MFLKMNKMNFNRMRMNLKIKMNSGIMIFMMPAISKMLKISNISIWTLVKILFVIRINNRILPFQINSALKLKKVKDL
jgi:hypothetical protein